MDCKKTNHRDGWRLLWVSGIVVLLLLSQKAQAQVDSSRATTRHALTYAFALTDYNSLDPIYQAANPGRFLHPEDINYAASLGYHYRLQPSVSLGATLRVGSMDAHHTVYDASDSLCQPCEQRIRNELFVGVDVLGYYHFTNGYLLPEQYWVAPYALAGIAAVYMDERRGHWDAQVPLGIGSHFFLSSHLALQLQLEYRLSLAVQKHNLALVLGLYWQLGRPTATE